MPLASIVIVTRGRSEWLRQAIDSVKRQTMTDFDCVIVGNGDRDLAGAIAQTKDDARFSINTIEATGIGAARNFGATLAHGEFILFLDDDDVLRSEALAMLLLPMRMRPRLSGCYGLPYLIDANNNRLNGGATIGHRPRGGELHLADLARSMNMVSPPGCAILRKSSFVKAGMWDETGEVRESVELFIRLLQVGPMQCVPQPVIGYRQHPGQTSLARNAVPAQIKATEARLQAALSTM